MDFTDIIALSILLLFMFYYNVIVTFGQHLLIITTNIHLILFYTTIIIAIINIITVIVIFNVMFNIVFTFNFDISINTFKLLLSNVS